MKTKQTLLLVLVWILSCQMLWAIVTPTFSGGSGTSTDPYKIATLADLQYLSEHSAYWGTSSSLVYYVQTADIDVSDTKNWNSGAGFSPIGNSTTYFWGYYDGQGHTISGLYINRPTTDAIGLFGYCGRKISNLGVENVDITGASSTGGLSGACGNLLKCYSTGRVKGTNSVGGIIGYNLGLIDSCYSTCNVTGSGEQVGGFIGTSMEWTGVNSCFSTGNVTGGNYTGGFAGLYIYSSSSMAISNCYSRGNVSGANYTGGFIGYNGSSTSNLSTIKYCYSTGSVTATGTYKGGFAGGNGYVSRKPDIISNSYWDTESSGMTIGCGVDSKSGFTAIGYTTAQMKVQANLGNLDFTSIWKMDGTNNDGYPYLQWQTFETSKTDPVITWTTPADITYGTALSATQLNATADVAGTFVYSPSVDSVLSVGDNQKLLVEFTPTDASSYNTVKDSVYINVTKATPVITWATPADITYGTALSATQLNATVDVEGAFVYSPAADSVLSVGDNQKLLVEFTPTDTESYNTVKDSVYINVTKATPVITWATPADITYSTALSATQLNATADVAGTFVYSPAAETVLSVGSHDLTTIFTPTDTENYNLAYDTVSIVVQVYAPTIQATNITFKTTSSSSITISWTRGNGSSSAIFMAEASTLAATPVDSINYSDNTTYGLGNQIGTTGWYCVRNGDSDSSNDGYTITGLTPETEYTVRIFECANLLYNTNTAIGNPANITTTAAAKTPDKILVSGITDPTAANGTYLKGEDMNGKPSWNMTVGEVTYYIYSVSGEHGTIHYWVIDNNTGIEDDAVFYIMSADDLPPTTGYFVISGEGAPILTYQYITTNINKTENNFLSIFPNPARNQFSISGLKEVSEVTVIDMNGKVLKSQNVANGEAINIVDLQAGIYIVEVINNTATSQYRLVKK